MQQCVVNNDRGDSSSAPDNVIVSDWMPLLLIVPLRLGLSEINPVYINGLKVCDFALQVSLVFFIYCHIYFQLFLLLTFYLLFISMFAEPENVKQMSHR